MENFFLISYDGFCLVVENLKVAMEVIESTMSDFKQKQRDMWETSILHCCFSIDI